MDDTDKLAADLLHLRGRHLAPGDPVTLPLTLSTMYHLPGDPAGVHGYGRADNPVWEALEKALGHLEQAETLVFPSGMAAISAALFATLKGGDRLLIPSDGYYTTRLLADRFLQKFGVTIETRPTTALADGGFAGFAAVFAVALVIISIFTPLLSGAVQNSALGPIDQGLGLLFGVARGVLLVVIALVVYERVLGGAGGFAGIDESRSKAIFAGLEQQLAAMLPDDAPQWIAAQYERLTANCR